MRRAFAAATPATEPPVPEPKVVLVTAAVVVVAVNVRAPLFNVVPKPGCAVSVITPDAPVVDATTIVFAGLRLILSATAVAIVLLSPVCATAPPRMSTPIKVQVSTVPLVVPEIVRTPVPSTSFVLVPEPDVIVASKVPVTARFGVAGCVPLYMRMWPLSKKFFQLPWVAMKFCKAGENLSVILVLLLDTLWVLCCYSIFPTITLAHVLNMSNHLQIIFDMKSLHKRVVTHVKNMSKGNRWKD